MNSDVIRRTYTANAGRAALTSGSNVWTGQAAGFQAASEVMACIGYNLPDDTGVTITWGIQWSPDLSTWNNITEASVTDQAVAVTGAGVYQNRYGLLDGASRYIGGAFIRILATVSGLSDDTMQVFGWFNIGRDNGPIWTKDGFRDTLDFEHF